MPEQSQILLVDDQRMNILVMERYLAKLDSQTMTARNGKKALEMLLGPNNNFDLVITDWIMPEMDGTQLIAAMKSDPELADIPIIMQTTRTYSDDITAVCNLSAANFLPKPLKENSFLATVKRCLTDRRQIKMAQEFIRQHQPDKITPQSSPSPPTENKESTAQQKQSIPVSHIIPQEHDPIQGELEACEIFSDFFIKSLGCNNFPQLAQLLLETVKSFRFVSAEGPEESNDLRCTIRLAGADEEVDVSDRGLLSKTDKLLLQRAMESRATMHRGNFTAIPASSGTAAILVRNTPTDKNEADQACQQITILLERFAERLRHFEDEMAGSDQESVDDLLASLGL